MIRSLLFAPGDSEKKMTKASEGDADVVILDLEDSVSESQKVSARGMVTEFLKAKSKEVKPRLYVRVNPLDTGYCLSDIADVVTGGPAGILLPKCNSGSDIQKLSSYLDVLEVANGFVKDSIKIIAVATETAASVFNMGSYENCSARLNGITWGAEDLGAAVRASTSLTSTKDWTSPYQMVRSLCLFGAYAANVEALDTVMADFRDTSQLAIVCDQARKDGFTGKLAIHPCQVDVINQAFTPTKEEIEHSRAVLALFEQNPDAGTLQLDGKMIDKPHIEQAKKILDGIEDK